MRRVGDPRRGKFILEEARLRNIPIWIRNLKDCKKKAESGVMFPLEERMNFPWRGIINDTNLVWRTLFLLIDYVRKYATEEALRDQENGGTGNGMSSDSESSMSDFSEDEAQDMEL